MGEGFIGSQPPAKTTGFMMARLFDPTRGLRCVHPRNCFPNDHSRYKASALRIASLSGPENSPLPPQQARRVSTNRDGRVANAP